MLLPVILKENLVWLIKKRCLGFFCGISELQNVPLNDTTKNPKQCFLTSQSRFYFKINNINPKCLHDDQYKTWYVAYMYIV